jgi:hypothetical protein
VLELPLDFNADPLSVPFATYLKKYESMVDKKPFEKMFHLLNHSWSLMKLDDNGRFNTYVPEHEDRLHEILAHMRENGRIVTFSEYLDSHTAARPVRLLYEIRPENPELPEYVRSTDMVRCNVCDAAFSTKVMIADVCPSCESVTSHRQFQQMTSTYGNVLDGRKVLGFEHAERGRWGMHAGAAEVVPAESAAELRHVPSESVEAVVALRLINSRADAGVIDEVNRVLTPGGVFVSMIPYVDLHGGQSVDDGFSLDEYVALLSETFTVASPPGYDPVSGRAARVFLAYKRG